MAPNPSLPNDPEDMLGQVTAWPDLFGLGFQQPIELPETLQGKSAIVCCGMGGSAIGAGIVGDYLADQLSVPYQVIRDYQLPPWVGSDTLVLCLSHSGGTEETLSAYDAARQVGAAMLVISTGGELLAKAERDSASVIRYESDSQPRAALPQTLGLLLKVFSSLGYVAPPEIDPAIAALKQLIAEPPTDDLSESLSGKVPIVYGAGPLSEAARRLKGQISENAKQTAAWEVLPELNHNALVGYQFPEGLAERVSFVLLRSSLEHPRHRSRFEITKDLLKQHGLPFLEISGGGDDRLSQLLTALYQGDLLSVRLAGRTGVDPTPVDIITVLKDRLAES